MMLNRRSIVTLVAVLVAAVAASVAAAPQDKPAPPPQAKEAAATLQGSWEVTSFNDQAPPAAIVLSFDGTKYQVVIDGTVDETGTFKLDASKTPWTLDLNIQEGNDAGQVQLGIVEKKGDAIHGLLAAPGGSTRPAAFDSADGAIAFIAVKKK